MLPGRCGELEIVPLCCEVSTGAEIAQRVAIGVEATELELIL